MALAAAAEHERRRQWAAARGEALPPDEIAAAAAAAAAAAPKLSRETWMTEVPPEMRAVAGAAEQAGPRQFSRRALRAGGAQSRLGLPGSRRGGAASGAGLTLQVQPAAAARRGRSLPMLCPEPVCLLPARRFGVKPRGDTTGWTDTPEMAALRAAGKLPAPGVPLALAAPAPRLTGGEVPVLPGVAAAVREYNEKHRQKSLLEQHAERKAKEGGKDRRKGKDKGRDKDRDGGKERGKEKKGAKRPAEGARRGGGFGGAVLRQRRRRRLHSQRRVLRRPRGALRPAWRAACCSAAARTRAPARSRVLCAAAIVPTRQPLVGACPPCIHRAAPAGLGWKAPLAAGARGACAKPARHAARACSCRRACSWLQATCRFCGAGRGGAVQPSGIWHATRA